MRSRYVADRARHHEAHRQRGVYALLAGGRLDEVGARHHADQAGARHVAQGAQLAGRENRLDVRVAARLAHRAHLIVERRPVLGEHVGAGDDDVDLLGAGGHGCVNLADALLERRKTGGKAGGYRRHRNPRAFERIERGLDEGVVDADGSHSDGQPVGAHRLEQVGPDRAPGLGAEPPDPAGSVVAREGGEVHQGDGAKQPCRLPFALDRPAGPERRRAPLDRAAVDPDLLDPVELEGHAGVAWRHRDFEARQPRKARQP